MKKMLIVTTIIMTILGVGCFDKKPNYEKEQTRQTQTLMNEALKQVGLPAIKNFQQRKLFKLILEKADKSNLITYTYMWSEFKGKFIYLGRSIGYGIPFSAQYTNPSQIVGDPYGNRDAGGKVIPQPDPNGLYMPTSSSATWLLLIDESTGRLSLVYIEPTITVTEIPLPSHIVEGYPPDFWKKYSAGLYKMTKEEVKQKINEFATRR